MSLIHAEVVWDGGTTVTIPKALGTPRDDQVCGTVGEKVAEIAGRSCYDSLGKGRSSTEYHQHILQVGHLSVYEHYNFTIEIDSLNMLQLVELVGRPGLWLDQSKKGQYRLTVNARTILDWDKFPVRSAPHVGGEIRNYLASHAIEILPNLFNLKREDGVRSRVVEPETDSERWITMYMSGSRGFSHEQVRHGDFSAISQRSTRYVDESESGWVEHPLIREFVNDATDTAIPEVAEECIRVSRRAYRVTVQELESHLIDRGVDKTSARKQARGAARGFLGNALFTEMLFSANVAQWRRMLDQRATRFADAEIRQVYAKVLPALQNSRHGSRFRDYQQHRSPDGIGMVASKRGL